MRPVVVVRMTLSGDPSAFDAAAQEAFRLGFASLIDGVSADDVTVRLRSRRTRQLQSAAGSFGIDVNVISPDAAAASATSSAVGNASTAQLSSALGFTVDSVATPAVETLALAAPSPPPPSPPPPSPPPPTPPPYPSPPPARPSWCPTGANLTDVQLLLVDDVCLASSTGLNFGMYPCPLTNTSAFLDDIFLGWRFENMVGSLWSVVVACSLMQIGGVPAPRTLLTGVLWSLWMVCQTGQLLLVTLSLVSTVFAYLQNRVAIGPCMRRLGGHAYNASMPFDDPGVTAGLSQPALLDIITGLTMGVQPAILTKVLIVMLYLYALQTGLEIYELGRGRRPRVIAFFARLSTWIRRLIKYYFGLTYARTIEACSPCVLARSPLLTTRIRSLSQGACSALQWRALLRLCILTSDVSTRLHLVHHLRAAAAAAQSRT